MMPGNSALHRPLSVVVDPTAQVSAQPAHSPVPASAPHRPRNPQGPVDEPFRMSDESCMVGEGQRRKSAPTGAATPHGRGLADRKDNDRLMATLPRPADTTPPCTEPHVDGCPECAANYEEPYLRAEGHGGCSCAYRCSDCGHQWTTNYGRCR